MTGQEIAALAFFVVVLALLYRRAARADREQDEREREMSAITGDEMHDAPFSPLADSLRGRRDRPMRPESNTTPARYGRTPR